MATSVLIVFPGAFERGWEGAAPRLLDTADGFCEQGWRVALLAGAKPTRAPVGPEARFPGPVLRTASRHRWRPLWMDRRGLRRVWQLFLDAAAGGAAIDERLPWAQEACAWYCSIDTAPRPDAIWAVSNATLLGMDCARLLARAFECPYIVEFRDPYPPHGCRVSGLAEDRYEECLLGSSAVVTTTASLAKHLSERYPALRDRVHVVRHCSSALVDPGRVQYRQDGELRLLHAGMVYGGRIEGAFALLRAVAAARARVPDMRRGLRIDFMGAGGDGAKVRLAAARLGLGGIVRMLPQAPREVAWEAMQQADVLVLIKHDDPRYGMQVPGKTYEYMAHGKPILAVMPTCEAADVVMRSGLALVARASDTSLLTEHVVNLWQNRAQLGLAYQPDWGYVSSFSRPAMKARVVAVVRGLLA